MGINKFGQIGKLKEEKIEEYERLHADVWPDVLKKISECNIRNYSIFRFQSYVFSYFEYIGSDYEEDMRKMEADPVTREWWMHTHPCFQKYSIPGHESIIITNVSDEDAYIKITLLYTDKEPVSDLEICVKARRVRCLRTNEEKDFGKYTAEFGEQYAIMLESNTPVVAQYGRAEPRTVAFYTTTGYSI